LRKKPVACFVASGIRKYAATIVVALCVLLVALINLSSEKETGGSILNSFAKKNDEVKFAKSKIAAEIARKNNLATTSLLHTNSLTKETSDSVNYEDFYSTDDYAMTYQPEPTIGNQILLASIGPQTPVAKEKRGIRTYEVKSGDTAGSIAASFGLSTSTILSANNLSDTSLLKPGDKLSILPITGVSYKVQKGDSIESIAKKYNIDVQKVIAFNELTADGKLKEGKTLILPDGYLSPVIPATAAGTQLATAAGQPQNASYAPIKLGGGGAGHRFPYGYCTWYVSQKRYIPWGGNASSWLANARASGKATGRTPRPGAIVVTTESRWGHVALVESVKGSTFTISEMNYAGFGKKSTRTLSTGSRVVRGFIY
jgi:surface antigen